MKDVIDAFRTMSSAQIAAVFVVISSLFSSAIFVENRYAKLQETKKSIIQKEREISVMRDEMIQMHAKTLELIRLLPKEQQDLIEKNARAYTEQIQRLNQSKELNAAKE